MGLAEKRQADVAMASRLKEQGERRTTTRCPICERVVPVDNIYGHNQAHCAEGGATAERE